MAQPTDERLIRAYRQRLAAVHAEINRQIEELYGDVDPDAIDASFAAFVEKAAPVIEAGQQSTSALAAAFLRTFTLTRTGRQLEFVEDDTIPGTRADGSPVAGGMAAFGSLMLGRIAEGIDVGDAMDYGRYLATRYADGELTSAVDRTIAEQSRDRFSSWEGLVSAGACDPCQANAGEHPVDVEIYRHPGCNCTYVPLIDLAS